MQDSNLAKDNTPKSQAKRITELNYKLIQAERGEIKLTLEEIVNNVMEVVYFMAIDEGERHVVDLNIARVYKRGFLAAQKCGFNIYENQSIISFLLNGFQTHVNRYVQSQQKELSRTLDVS